MHQNKQSCTSCRNVPTRLLILMHVKHTVP